MAGAVIEAQGLAMRYGSLEAVRGIDLEVMAGEVFAFLGPNGAGKTTTVEILEGYRRRSAGEVSVLGTDPARPTRAWRERVGIVLQSCRLQPELTVTETVALHAAYYPHPRGVDDTIELVGLADQRRQRAGKLSGGLQRRLDVALAMVGDPELLFLDEPTTGFDPSARRSAWSLIAGLRDLGTTVFLTTHYLEEAEALADRVAIISAGRIVATGRPRRRPGRRGRGRPRLQLRPGGRPARGDGLGARARCRPSRPGRGPPEPGGRVPRPHRRGRAVTGDARLVLHQSRYEIRTFLRDPAATFFTLALPVVFLVLFVAIFGNQTLESGIDTSTYYWAPRRA